MKKIPTLFVRDPNNLARLINQVHPECAWVIEGEGVATRKLDGTSCMFDGQHWWKRREVKANKPIPEGFQQATYDDKTGKRTGWMPVEASDKWHLEAIQEIEDHPLKPTPGTYELVGPKVQGNPEGYLKHYMIEHAMMRTFPYAPVDFEGLRDWLSQQDMEGVVWHHPDGRMAKIKRRDFGLDWPLKQEDIA